MCVYLCVCERESVCMCVCVGVGVGGCEKLRVHLCVS